MILRHLIVKTVEGEISYSRKDLPLRVGTGNDCQVRLPGPGGSAVAMLDLLDGILIIQPVTKDSHLFLNDKALDATRRLSDGDIVKFFGRLSNHVVVQYRLLNNIDRFGQIWEKNDRGRNRSEQLIDLFVNKSLSRFSDIFPQKWFTQKLIAMEDKNKIPSPPLHTSMTTLSPDQ